MFLSAEDFVQYLNSDETALKMAMFNPPDMVEFFKEANPEYFDTMDVGSQVVGGIIFTGPDVNEEFFRVEHNVALGKIYQYNDDDSFVCEMGYKSQTISPSTMMFIMTNRDKLLVRAYGNWTL